jgi:hypothetical protein
MKQLLILGFVLASHLDSTDLYGHKWPQIVRTNTVFFIENNTLVGMIQYPWKVPEGCTRITVSVIDSDQKIRCYRPQSMNDIVGINRGLISKNGFLIALNPVSKQIISCLLPENLLRLENINSKIVCPQIISYNPNPRSVKLNLGPNYEYFTLYLKEMSQSRLRDFIKFKHKACPEPMSFVFKPTADIFKRFANADSSDEIQRLYREFRDSAFEEIQRLFMTS